MTLEDCYKQHQGTAILVPGGGAGNNGQCVQWADTVYHDVYGLPYVYTPAAIDWWNNADALGITQHFDKIPAGTAIQKGDLVVYYPLSSGDPQGHIDVCSQSGSVSDFWAYDSNWNARDFHDANGYPTLHEVHHNDSFNNKIAGYLRPKGEVITPTVQQGDVDAIFKVFLGVSPTSADYAFAVGKTWDVYIKAVMGRSEATVKDGDVRALFAKFITTPVAQADLDFARGMNFRKYIGLVMARPDCVDVSKPSSFKPYSGDQLYTKS